MQMMKIEIATNETPKAFRVNGVTIAKRHLREIFAGDDIKDDTRLAMFLATVPDAYLSGAAEFILEKAKAKSTNHYAAKKVMRLWNALRLTPAIAEPFKRVAVELAGEEAKRHIKRRVKEMIEKDPALAKHFDRDDKPDFAGSTDGTNVIQFPKKPTVH